MQLKLYVVVDDFDTKKLISYIKKNKTIWANKVNFKILPLHEKDLINNKQLINENITKFPILIYKEHHKAATGFRNIYESLSTLFNEIQSQIASSKRQQHEHAQNNIEYTEDDLEKFKMEIYNQGDEDDTGNDIQNKIKELNSHGKQSSPSPLRSKGEGEGEGTFKHKMPMSQEDKLEQELIEKLGISL